jgi:hypothetical protein
LQALAAALAGGPVVTGGDANAIDATFGKSGADTRRWRATGSLRGQPSPEVWRLTGEFWLRDPDEIAAPRIAETAAMLWRRDQVVRGRGRGGRIETVTLAWQDRDADNPRPELVVRSRRRAGALYFWPLTASDVRYPPIETFLPMWPLDQILAR